jgi:hypothetical protein
VRSPPQESAPSLISVRCCRNEYSARRTAALEAE